MIYDFDCIICKKEIEVEIPISNYDKEKDKQKCPVCNSILKRKLEWKGPATINGGYEAIGGRAKWQ